MSKKRGKFFKVEQPTVTFIVLAWMIVLIVLALSMFGLIDAEIISLPNAIGYVLIIGAVIVFGEEFWKKKKFDFKNKYLVFSGILALFGLGIGIAYLAGATFPYGMNWLVGVVFVFELIAAWIGLTTD